MVYPKMETNISRQVRLTVSIKIKYYRLDQKRKILEILSTQYHCFIGKDVISSDNSVVYCLWVEFNHIVYGPFNSTPWIRFDLRLKTYYCSLKTYDDTSENKRGRERKTRKGNKRKNGYGVKYFPIGEKNTIVPPILRSRHV